MKTAFQDGKVYPITELRVPDVLYKYRSFQDKYHRKALFEQEVYFPSANELNDPFDTKIPFRYNEEELTNETIYRKRLQIAKRNYPDGSEQEHQQMAYDADRANLLNDDKHLSSFDNQFFEQINRDFGIFCLTPSAENFLMWSYYSQSHTGFCIGYNTRALLMTDLFALGGKVRYEIEFPKFSVHTSDVRQNGSLLFLNTFYTKWKIWCHEQEYRLVHMFKRGKIHKLPADCIDEIVFGCKFSENEVMKLIPKLQNINPSIAISQIRLSNSKFGIEKVVISCPDLFLGDFNKTSI